MKRSFLFIFGLRGRERRGFPVFRFILSAFVTLLLSGSPAQGSQPTSPDDQLWQETRLIFKLDPQFTLFTAGAFRLTDDFGHLTQVSGRWGFGWQAMPGFTVTPSYLYTAHDPASSNSTVENRFCLMMAQRIPLQTATLTAINTTEYRRPEGQPASWRLRPKVTLSNPLGPDNLGLSGYVAEEIFYDTGANALTRDRVFAGLKKKWGGDLEVELYYCREFNFVGTRPDSNIVGINVRIILGSRKLPTPDEQDSQ